MKHEISRFITSPKEFRSLQIVSFLALQDVIANVKEQYLLANEVN